MNGRQVHFITVTLLSPSLPQPPHYHPSINHTLLPPPPSLTVYFSSLHLSTPPPSSQLSTHPSIIHNRISPLFFHLLSLPHAPLLLSCKVLPVHRLTLSLSCLEAITNLHGELLNYVRDDDV